VDPNVFGGTAHGWPLALMVVQWAVATARPAQIGAGAPGAGESTGLLLSLVARELARTRRRLLLSGAALRRILVLGTFAGLVLLATTAGQEYVVRFHQRFLDRRSGYGVRVGE